MSHFSTTFPALLQASWTPAADDMPIFLRPVCFNSQSAACNCAFLACRWCCSGTPVGNDITDLLGQFAVLRMSPFSINNFFLAHVKTAFTGSMYNRSSAVPLLYMLSKTMIRHTKLQVRSLPARSGLVGVVFCESAPEGHKLLDRQFGPLCTGVTPGSCDRKLSRLNPWGCQPAPLRAASVMSWGFHVQVLGGEEVLSLPPKHEKLIGGRPNSHGQVTCLKDLHVGKALALHVY